MPFGAALPLPARHSATTRVSKPNGTDAGSSTLAAAAVFNSRRNLEFVSLIDFPYAKASRNIASFFVEL